MRETARTPDSEPRAPSPESPELGRRDIWRVLSTVPAAALLRATRIISLLLAIGISVPHLALPMQDQDAGKGLEGTWEGTLGSGAAKLRLVLTISRSSQGAYCGILDSVDQGATLPVDRITAVGSKVRLELKSIGGVYEGELSKDSADLIGTWIQTAAPQPQPLSFKKTTGQAPAAAAAATTAAGPRPKPLDAPVDAVVPVAPTAFRADGKVHLVYELHITNFSREECTLTGVGVRRGDDDNKLLAHYQGLDLVERLARPRVPAAIGLDKLRVGPGLRGVVYLWVTLDSPAEVPVALEHQASVKVGDDPQEFTVTCGRIPVHREVTVLGPPLRGDQWLAANGPANNSPHRRALIPVGGSARISQRFAIDWVRLRDDGKTFTGDPLDNKNYRAYGSEVLAVADGVVSEMKDGIPQNVPGENSRAVPITLETIGGNHIILDLGRGRYAFYAHLQPGSTRVKAGDQVHRGQVLALVGNTGNSTEPHLHFHLSDASSPLGSEGLPYAFESFEVQGKGQDWRPSGVDAEKHRMEMPTENEVVRFPSEL